MIPKVKICGLTRAEDVRASVEAGADGVGFVFADGSPRRVEPQTARRLAREVPAGVLKFGIFADAPAHLVRELAASVPLDVVQLHGDEPPRFAEELSDLVLVKAFRIRDASSLDGIEEYRVWARLVDTYSPRGRGGTGETFDWEMALRVKRYGRLILAGGLGPENVAEAVRRVDPDWVDASSSLETGPGAKDRAKIAAFVHLAKEAHAL